MTTISRTRRVLAVVAVTTALCADQAVIAMPAARPQAIEFAQMASRLVDRLTRGLQRAMPVVVHQPQRQQRSGAVASPVLPVQGFASPHHTPVSPFQFRLPPPAL